MEEKKKCSVCPAWVLGERIYKWVCSGGCVD